MRRVQRELPFAEEIVSDLKQQLEEVKQQCAGLKASMEEGWRAGRAPGLFKAVFSTLKLTRQAGFKPWSVEGSALVRLMLSAARKSREASGLKLRKQHVFQTAHRLSGTRKGRERIADALAVSTIDAWMVQDHLKRAVVELEGLQAHAWWRFRSRA